HIRFASQTSAADRATAESQVQSRLFELGQYGLLDLVQRQASTGCAMLHLLERAWDLSDTVAGIALAGTLDRIVVDDGLQDEGVVRVHPECHLLLARPALVDVRSHVQRRRIPVEPSAIRPKRPIVDEPITNVQVEDL